MKNFRNKIINLCGRGLSTFVFFLLMFSLLRLIFIIALNEYTHEVSISDEMAALWYGLRLSCQTSGLLTVIVMMSSLISKNLMKIITFTILFLTSVLYIASFPFYRQFHSNFNQMVFNAINEDYYALLITLIDGFDLPLRLIFALILSFFLYKIFFKIPMIKIHGILIAFLMYLVINLSIFGGGLNWQTELNFENIGITKDKFLNEAILDSYQAIYRGYVLKNRIASSSGLNFTPEMVISLAAWHANVSPNSNDIDDYLRHKAKGALISKPKHIFVIISESYANWPLLEKYSDLHIADGVKSIIEAEDSDYCPTFLPNGANTVSAVTGIVTDFADANL